MATKGHETDVTRRQTLKTAGLAAGGLLLGGSAVAGRAAAGLPRGSADRRDLAAGRGARVVDVVATHDHDTGEHGFDLSTDTVPTGWTTFVLDNPTEHTHFTYMSRIPQAAKDDAAALNQDLFEFWMEHIAGPFQWFMDTLVPDKEADPALLSDLYTDLENGVIFPEWFKQVAPSGGVGLLSAGESATTTLNLAPGTYLLECYAKDADNDFHGIEGMATLFEVTPGFSRAPNPGPETTVEVSVSTAGIAAPDAVRPGQHTVAVTFENQQVYEHLLGHDVHLVRLEDDGALEDAAGWMNWMDPAGLVSAGDDPEVFLGGVQDVVSPGLLDGSESAVAYVHVALRPGNYAWIAEVPDPVGKGLVAEFTVSGSAPRGRLAPSDPGSSRNWGPAPEAADDDIPRSLADSRMPDEFKTVFDALANYDLEDIAGD